MKVTRNTAETALGPKGWFTGTVYIDTIKPPTDTASFQVMSVHFAPGARTAWHTHPKGQALYVTEGVGRVQKRGAQVQAIHPGDTVTIDPGEEHWHGAAPDRFMTHIAMHDFDQHGKAVSWGDQVSDEEYLKDAMDR